MFNNKKEKICFVAGGGTGGHIYPAISVINSLIESGLDKKNIFYLGNKKNLEFEIAKKYGYNFLSYGAKAMPRKLSLQFFIWLFNLFLSTLKAFLYVIKYKPCVIFATGGYICAPVLFCAVFLRIPYVLHDCDIQPGIVTRFFSPFAKSVSLAFCEAKNYIKSKNIFINGNPIRHEFKTISKKQAREELSLKDSFTILIMGGSLGAKTINNAAYRVLREFADKDEVKILWQTGKKNFDEVTEKIIQEFRSLPDNLVLQPYFDKMYLALLSADLVVSRAGSLSLSEICACSLPAILVPYPYAASDHQKKNAQNLVENKCAIMIEDKNCDGETLLKTINMLINDKRMLSDLSYNAYKNAKLNAVDDIIKQIKKASGINA